MKPDLPAGWGFRPHSRRKFMRRLIVQSLLANRAVLRSPQPRCGVTFATRMA